MIRMLRAFGIPPRLLRAVEAIYFNTCAIVVTPDGDTEEFAIAAGVLQGDTLTPFLFAIVLDYALRIAINDNEIGLRPRRSSTYQAIAITDMTFAHDIALITNDATQAQNRLASIVREFLFLNGRKTKVMT